MLSRVALVRTEVSEELSASFIMVTRVGELGTTLAVTRNQRTLRRYTKLVLTRATRRNIPVDTVYQFSRPEPLLFFQVAPHLSSQGLSGPRSRLLRKSGSAGNRTRNHWVSSQEL
jgi:hypothetical protein